MKTHQPIQRAQTETFWEQKAVRRSKIYCKDELSPLPAVFRLSGIFGLVKQSERQQAAALLDTLDTELLGQAVTCFDSA